MTNGVPGLTYLLEFAGRRLADLEALVVQKDAEAKEWMQRALDAGWTPEPSTNGKRPMTEETVR